MTKLAERQQGQTLHIPTKTDQTKGGKRGPKAGAVQIIIGSDASRHVVSSRELLNGVQNMEPMPVGLADGTTEVAHYSWACEIDVGG